MKSLILRLGLLLFCLASGCSGAAEQEVAVVETPGVSDNEILLGSCLALTGHASFLGTQTLHGALCYLRTINEAGGVHGRSIKVIAYDDGYDPPRPKPAQASL